MKAARYFRTLLVAGMFAASILGSEANSAIVEADWQAVNDGLLTEDTSTGLKWLDLTETANMSFNDVSARRFVPNISATQLGTVSPRNAIDA